MMVALGATTAIAALIALVIVFAVSPPNPDAELDCNRTAEVDAQSVDVSVGSLLPRTGEPLEFAWNFKHRRGTFQESTKLKWEIQSQRELPGDATADAALGSDAADALVLRRGDLIGVEADPFRTRNNDGFLNPRSVDFYAVVIEGGVQVTMCVTVVDVSPGTYFSVIQFEDPDIKAAPIAVELTIKQGDLRVPILSGLVGMWIAALLIILRWRQLSDEGKPPQATAIIVGVVVATFGVSTAVLALWNNNPVWGTDPIADSLAIISATALGIFGSAAVGEVAGIAKRSNRQPDDDSNRSAAEESNQ